MANPMRFRQFHPRPELRPYVQRLWTLQGKTHTPERILPDGRIEIIFHFGDRFELLTERRTVIQPRLIFAGQITRPVVLGGSGSIDALGITLHAHAAGALLGFPAEAITGALVDAHEIGDLVSVLEPVLLGTRDAENRVTAVQSALVHWVRNCGSTDVTVEAAIARIRNGAGAVPVSKVASAIGTTDRSLQRAFDRHVGLTPKQFSRIVRFQTALQALDDDATLNMVEAALRHGYYDQAHLVHEFQELAGVPPTKLLERMDGITRLFAGS